MYVRKKFKYICCFHGLNPFTTACMHTYIHAGVMKSSTASVASYLIHDCVHAYIHTCWCDEEQYNIVWLPI